MHSSISSFERHSSSAGLRLTASDRPGVAQPVPERDLPARPWRGIAVTAALLLAVLLGCWEWHWRAFGNAPAYQNSNGLWARERRRVDQGDAPHTVLVGDSRMLFDLDLDTWERLSGERPIQLSIEGTSALFTLEDLATDTQFKGRVLVGVAPQVFFSGFGFRADVVKYFHRESPSERIGQWLSMYSVEQLFAFDDEDFALATVLERQPWWPAREGLAVFKDVRKLSVSASDRNTHLWSKVENDETYRALAQSIWAQRFGPLDPAHQAKLDGNIRAQVQRATAAIATLRARGVNILFVRPPSAGRFLDYENRDFARSKTWDQLLSSTGAPGVYFSDYPTLQDYVIPEWSHLAASERPRFTTALYSIIAQRYGDFLAPSAAP